MPSNMPRNAGRGARRGKRVAKPVPRSRDDLGKPEGMEAASLVAALRLCYRRTPGAPGRSLYRMKQRYAHLHRQRLSNRLSYSTSIRPGNTRTCLPHYGVLFLGVAARAIENSSAEAVHEAHATGSAPFRQYDGATKSARHFDAS